MSPDMVPVCRKGCPSRSEEQNIKKIRLDHLVAERGLAESGAKAQALIMAGQIRTPGLHRAAKPGEKVSVDQPVELVENLKYVSRGGEKLAGALDGFLIDVKGRFCLDIGASTGGFTDCLLQRGAEKVLSVDVGHGQLHWKLRQDKRVVNLEKRHVLNLTSDCFKEFVPDFVTVDVSFISLEKVLPHLSQLLKAGTEFVCLVKPQFEAGPQHTPKGVVRDPKVREQVLKRLSDLLSQWGFDKKGEMESPLKGPKGNVEYFLYFFKNS